jgi:hypothetical protein
MHLRALLDELGKRLNDADFAGASGLLEKNSGDGEFVKLGRHGVELKVGTFSSGRVIRPPQASEVDLFLRRAERAYEFSPEIGGTVGEFLNDRKASGIAYSEFGSPESLKEYFLDSARKNIANVTGQSPDEIDARQTAGVARCAMQFLLGGFGNTRPRSEIVSCMEPRMAVAAMLLLAEEGRNDDERRSCIAKVMTWLSENFEVDFFADTYPFR